MMHKTGIFAKNTSDQIFKYGTKIWPFRAGSPSLVVKGGES